MVRVYAWEGEDGYYMKWHDYISEIELIIKQNNIEYDLYTVIANVLKERKVFKNFSLRFVGNHMRTEGTKLFWGLRGFPDFVVLDREYVSAENSISRNKLFCAVEVKVVGADILKNEKKELNKDQKQLIGHLLWFNKVIFTNGLEWRFYENTFEASLGDIVSMQNYSFEKAFKYVNKRNKTNEDVKKEKEEISKVEKIIDIYLSNFDVADLKCDTFVLCKKEKDKRVWDNKEWKKLIKYLNNYSFVSSIKI